MPPAELWELELTLDPNGLSTSPERPAGGVRTWPEMGGVAWAALLVAAYAGYLFSADKSGGGSWKLGKLEAAGRRAVKL